MTNEADVLAPPDAAVGRRITEAPTIDLVVPVFNEQRALRASVERLHAFLGDGFPFTWRITIVDNASTDATQAIASELAGSLANVRAVRLERKGRGLALRTAWSASDAAVVAYMDVDLSTGLDALLPLVAPLVSGHSDVAIGSRLASGANVARGPKREVISRIYNLILRVVFANRFRDAQCGFKALRTDIAQRLLPEIADDQWFFDTELLLLAEHNGLRIHEVPVDWVDDPDSRVRIGRTAADDLKGSVRVAWRFATGNGEVDLGAQTRRPFVDDLGRRRVIFVLVGAVSTMVTIVLFVALRPVLGPSGAVVAALLATAAANSWAHRRWSLGRRGRTGLAHHAAVSIGLAVTGIALSLLAVAAVDHLGGAVMAELGALIFVWSLVAALRFRLLSRRAPTEPSDPSPNAETAP